MSDDARTARSPIWGLMGILGVLGLVLGVIIYLVAMLLGRVGVDSDPDSEADAESPAEPARPFVPGPIRPRGRGPSGHEEFTLDKDPSVILIRIEGASFTMGSEREADERPPHSVTLAGFYIARTELTNAQYRRYCDDTQTMPPPDPGFEGMADYFLRFPDHPVVRLSWNDARDYCAWAGLVLPTEAQWEYAARGMDDRVFPWGNESPEDAQRRLNYSGYPNDEVWRSPAKNGGERWRADGFLFTSKVGLHGAGQGPFGTQDQAGNVFEWCRDHFAPYASENRESPERVLRGGSFRSPAASTRCAYRDLEDPGARESDIGFRPARPL